MRVNAKRWVKVASAALAASVLATLAPSAWMQATARSATFPTAETAPPRTIAIVPGAGVWADGTPSHILEDRLRCAETAYREGRVQGVLVTGDHGTTSYDETGTMARWLVARGMPKADVIEDHAGFRTMDSMHRARAVFGVRDAIVCTQAFHLPRALFLARSFGIDAVGVVADRRPYRAAAWSLVREAIARPVALVEVRLLGHGARLLGPPA